VAARATLLDRVTPGARPSMENEGEWLEGFTSLAEDEVTHLADTLGVQQDELWAPTQQGGAMRFLQHRATVIWGREKWEALFPTLTLERQHRVADMGSKVGRAWMTHIPTQGKRDAQALLDRDVVLQLRLRLDVGMNEYQSVLADGSGRCKCRDKKQWNPAHAFVCASHKRQHNLRHTRIRNAFASVLRYHRCHVRKEVHLKGRLGKRGKPLRSDIVVDSGLTGGVCHLDATVAGASLAIRRGQVKKITAADIEEAKRAHARDRFLRMKEHRSVAPVEPNPAIPAIPVPMGEGEGRSRAEVVGEEDDDYLFNPARAMAVNRLIQPHLSATVTRKRGKYGFIDDCDDIEGRFFTVAFSVGGTMAKPTADLVRGIVRNPQHVHPPGFRTNPHAKASMNRYVYKRLSLAIVLQTRQFFNDGYRGGIRF
jgi:hypothetical protein